jgi:probable O-glycosylation ligase (exosortase A-associated)
MVFGAMFFLLPLSLRNATVAYLLWGWTSLIALPMFVYGFMASVPFVQIFAIITLVLLLRGKNINVKKFTPHENIFLLFIFAAQALLSATFSYSGLTVNWEVCTTLLKVLLFCIFMHMFLFNRLRIHIFLVLLTTAIAFYSVTEGLKFLKSGGAHNVQGAANLGDNNHTALAFVMVLPLIWYLFQYSKSKLARLGFASAFLFTCLAVMATNSRGGFLAMAGVAVWIIARSRRKFVGVIFVIAAATLVLQLAPAKWFNRMDTISTAVDVDTSFQGRLIAWKRASAIALDNPVLGGGFRSVQAPVLFDKYRDSEGFLGFIDTPRASYPTAAHSIYFEALSDIGFLGFIIFISIIVSAFVNRRRIKKFINSDNANLIWASDLADSIGGSLFAYLIGGAAVSMAYFEFTYVLVTLMSVIYLFVANEVKSKAG